MEGRHVMTRINTNISAINAKTNLNKSSSLLQKAQERLASGLKINRAGDNPAGLIISEYLRAEISGLNQAIDNTSRAMNMISTADAALSETQGLLINAQSYALSAANTGALSGEELDVLQSQFDYTMQSINRISNTTSFGNKKLFGGEMAVRTENASAQLQGIDVNSYTKPGTVEIKVTEAAKQAAATGNIAANQSADVTFTISGNKGSATISIGAGASQADVEQAINDVSDQTGVIASGGKITSGEYGSDQFVQVEFNDGSLDGITAGASEGTDVKATVNGVAVETHGNVIRSSGAIVGEFRLADGTGAGTYSFDIVGGGATFQIGSDATPNQRVTIGIPGVDTSTLGAQNAAGALYTLGSGQANSLLSKGTDFTSVLHGAIRDVSLLRGRLGALQKNVFETNINSLNVAVENISASESQIRNANFAEEATNLVKAQILARGGIGVLAQANQQPSNVIKLLS